MNRAEVFALVVLWAAFYIYWLVSARSAKPNVRSKRVYSAFNILFIFIVLALFRRLRVFQHLTGVTPGTGLAVLGLVICALGLSLAVWARKFLGKNWGMPMAVKQEPELVTTGPYRYVRHPIYSGLLLAMLGSALVSGAPWLIVFVCFATYFVASARVEEHLMLRQFPEQYSQYRARTSAIIPFVW